MKYRNRIIEKKEEGWNTYYVIKTERWAYLWDYCEYCWKWGTYEFGSKELAKHYIDKLEEAQKELLKKK